MSGFLSRIFQPKNERSLPPSASGDWSAIFGAGGQTYSGVDVTVDSAMSSAVVFACVRVLAESVAMLPLITFRRLADGGKERARDYPLYPVLHDSPNPELTSFEWRELMMEHCLTWGNHFSEIEWSNAGQVKNLWPLRPDMMQLRRSGGQLIYEYSLPNGQQTMLRQDQILHVRFMGNGLWGNSPIRTQMNSIGLDLATEEFGGRYFSNGAKPGIILTHPGRLTEEAATRLAKSWNDSSGGLKNAHRTRVLEEGMGVDTIGVPPEEAQFLQTRQFQRSVIAGWYRVPPHLIGDLQDATFSNIEQQALEFVVYSLQPWLVRTEQRMGLSLLSTADRQSYFIEHLVDGVLRGDSASRSAYFMTAIQNGWMSRNEVRALENLNPYDGGDEYLVPLNMAETGQEPDADLDPAEDGDEDRATGRGEFETRAAMERREDEAQSRQQVAWNMIDLFEDAAGRVVRREVADLKRAMAKAEASNDWLTFRVWLDTFYDELKGVIPDYYLAIMRSLSGSVGVSVGAELGEDAPDKDYDAFIDGFLEVMATGYVSEHENRLIDILAEEEEADRVPKLEAQLERWEENEPQLRGHDQALEATNALAIVAYSALGVTMLRWMSVGDSCPFCKDLDGKTADIDGYFVERGGSVTGADGEVFNSGQNRRHGPLHSGCDCVTIAVRE